MLSSGPGVASAHPITDARFAAPLPLPLLFIGAGATVALTAFWLAFMKPTSLDMGTQRPVFSIPAFLARPIRIGIQIVFLGCVLVALVLGFFGRQVPAENFATVFTWPVWFRGIALLAIIIGNPWGLLSPWRTIYQGLIWLEGRTFSVLETLPSVLGKWPSLVGFILLIGVIENLTVIPDSPRLTSVIIAAYAVLMIGGVTLFGSTWLGRADPLGVFYRLFGRVAPINIARTAPGGYSISLRPPWRGCLDPADSLAAVGFIIAMVYTVSFDGFTNTRLFQTILFSVRDVIGTGVGTRVLLYLIGFGGFVLTFGIGSWGVERFATLTGQEWMSAARWFAPTLLPIAAAYEVAHNYPYVIENLGHLLVMSVQWIGLGIESGGVLGWLSLPVFWGSQVVLIVLGHVFAVVAAHSVAVNRYNSPAAARRGHLPLVILMVGYTVCSLWIISQPVLIE